MLVRAHEADWCTADEFSSGDRGLRRDLQARGMGYVLAVAKSHRVTTSPVSGPQRADQIAATLRPEAWNRRSAGDGAKGPREHDWAWITITPPDDEQTGHHWLLVRRSLSDGELAFYRCWSPISVGLPTLVRVAGTRWCVETCFKSSKNATGLDEHQVRRWDSWYRYTTLVMLAHAILTVIAARERARRPPDDRELIPLTVNEIRRLFAKMAAIATHTITHWLAWSRWRRLHQARAQTSHYRRRGHSNHRLVST